MSVLKKIRGRFFGVGEISKELQSGCILQCLGFVSEDFGQKTVSSDQQRGKAVHLVSHELNELVHVGSFFGMSCVGEIASGKLTWLKSPFLTDHQQMGHF